MAEGAQTGHVPAGLIRAVQVAHEAEVRRSANGLRFATFGETGVPAPDLQSMIEAVPPAITAALKANTYYFVPLALREPDSLAGAEPQVRAAASDQAMVAPAYAPEFDEQAICHRNVALGSGNQGVFISTRLMGDRFALCFEFFINIAHAFADAAGVPESFATLVWEQATTGVRGETSMDAFEARNLALGRGAHDDGSGAGAANANLPGRRGRSFGSTMPASTAVAAAPVIDEKERGNFVSAAFSDALAVYLLSLAVDFDYSELREREYALLAPTPLAARLRAIAALFPPNEGYEFSVRYRRRA